MLHGAYLRPHYPPLSSPQLRPRPSPSSMVSLGETRAVGVPLKVIFPPLARG